MPFTRPVSGMPVTVEDFGQPVYDQLNGISQDKIPFQTTMRAAAGGNLGNSSQVCYYHRIGKWWHCVYMITYGSSTDGGTGAVTFTLPPGLTSTGSFMATCKTYIASVGLNYLGVAYCNFGETVMHPLFPSTSAVSYLQDYMGAAPGAQPGTGIPQVPGQYTIAPGANFQADIWVCGL